MRELSAVMKALADANRLRIVAALDGRELCLCQIVELLGLATSTVSRHLSLLERARIVDTRKEGRWTRFRLATDEQRPEAQAVAALVTETLRGDANARADAKRLREILKTDPEQFGCQHRGRSCCRFSFSAPATRAAARWPKAGRGT